MQSNPYLTKSVNDIYREIEEKTLSGFIEFDFRTEQERLKNSSESVLNDKDYTLV